MARVSTQGILYSDGAYKDNEEIDEADKQQVDIGIDSERDKNTL